MGANPHANGGLLLRDLRLPDFRDYAVKGAEPTRRAGEATRVMGEFLRDVMQTEPANFRVFGPDETARTAGALFEVTDRWVDGGNFDYDDHLAPMAA
jgi:xylulose-5-phosphate/fructose-6-phosphate phosphoketolase